MIYLLDVIKTDIRQEIYKLMPTDIDAVMTSTEMDNLAMVIWEDLEAFSRKDPAAKGSMTLIYETSLSFRAVLYYRIAHLLYQKRSKHYHNWYEITARKLSEMANRVSGIEIHPGAKIGERFIVDHGHSTVIGETTEIGTDCYILQGVTCGAKGISGNAYGKRHPTIGNNVQIGGHAQIFGPVTIGNNVFISPNSVITCDIPDDSSVIIVNQLQIIRNSSFNIFQVYGVVPSDNKLMIFGKGLSNLRCYLLDEEKLFGLDTITISDNMIQVEAAKVPKGRKISHAALVLVSKGVIVITIIGISHLLSM